VVKRGAMQGYNVAKEELLNFDGNVVDLLPDGRFRIKLDNEHEIIAYTAGRMKKNRIRTLVGDRVTVEMTPYDLAKGRIVYRHKDERAGGTTPGPRRRTPLSRRR
jgi:translation initiation factor IF-1